MRGSIVEAVAHLDEDFPRIQIVRSTEGEAVVQQHAAIGDVDALYVHREPFAKTLAERKIERGVRLQMIAGVGWRGPEA